MIEVLPCLRQADYPEPVEFFGLMPSTYSRGVKERAKEAQQNDKRSRIEQNIVKCLIESNSILKQDNKSLQDEVSKHSLDSLTGLFVRRRLAEDLPRELKRVQRDKSRLALVFIDCDGLGDANKSHSHAYGDRLLASMARGVTQTCRSEDKAYRFGGDEFVVVMNITDDLKMDDETLTDSISGRLHIGIGASLAEDNIGGGASIGIAFSEPFDSETSLVERASKAMFSHKPPHSVNVLSAMPLN